MKKIALICILVALCCTSIAQTRVKTDKQGNYIQMGRDSIVGVPTGKILTLTNGDKLPVLTSKTGKLYVIRTSKKTGATYRQYLKTE